jgi:Arc/MetJ family transcription regulator
MRVTVQLDEELVEKARQAVGIHDINALVSEGLKALVAREAARRLAALGGTMPGRRAAPRRRPKRVR